MTAKSHSNLTPKIVGTLAIAAVVASGAYAFVLRDTDGTDTTSSSSESSSSTDTSSSSSSSTNASTTVSTYNDGTYSATANYSVPQGSNSIEVTVTVSGDEITAVSAAHEYGSGDKKSAIYTDDFDSEISGVVVGKKIDSLNLSRVGGASLTTDGFNEALSDIVAQAKA